MNEQVAGLIVSRETLDRLHSYEALLRKWSARINLVAPSTISDLWQRHIVDSAQIFAQRGMDATRWADLGSGGGLPGIVCAILAKEMAPELTFDLIESDKRKAAFLTVCKQELNLPIHVWAERAEAAEPLDADVVSARALAPLAQLLPMVARHIRPGGVALLPKGKSYKAELEAACSEWQFDLESHQSLTDDLARILALKDIRRV